MYKFLTTAALAAFLATPSLAADTYTLDPAHTNIIWSADHFGFSRPSGKFTDVKGTLVLDEAKPENSKVEVTVATASVLTGIPKFDDHLKSKDFFNVDKFGDATFKSTKVTKTGKDTAKVQGDLTLLGVTKPVVLDAKLNKIGKNPFDKHVAGFTLSGTVKRSEFGMNYALPGVSDDVALNIEAEAIKD